MVAMVIPTLRYDIERTFLALMTPKETLLHLTQHDAQLLAIHYSCQNLGDTNEGLSPRITSIAVLHLSSSIMHSFSIHLVAERLHFSRSEIDDRYDELEKSMLVEFYEFMKSHADHLWLHWYMTNINYGFEAIAHRYAVLTEERAVPIPDSKKINLASLILDFYGDNCVDHPRMVNLMRLNGGLHRDLLSGAEEVEAFKNKEYIKLHKSTMCKVYWFKRIYYALQKGQINTSRSNIWVRINMTLQKSH